MSLIDMAVFEQTTRVSTKRVVGVTINASCGHQAPLLRVSQSSHPSVKETLHIVAQSDAQSMQLLNCMCVELVIFSHALTFAPVEARGPKTR